MFNGNDVTGKFPTKFMCDTRSQQLMYKDDDWCNIYHVCAGPRDNIFICPPGTVFSEQKQACFDRYSQNVCVGSSQYYKPSMQKKPALPAQAPVQPPPPPPSPFSNSNNNFNSFNSNNNNNNKNYLPVPTTNVNDIFNPYNNYNFNQNLNNFN